jgi:hypothetical protein
MVHRKEEPIVILGGFLSRASLYQDLAGVLKDVTDQAVSIVATRTIDWLGAAIPLGWLPLLRRLHRAVGKAVRRSETGKVTLIAHSAGGVLARIYLSPDPFYGTAFRGLDHISQLITLGTPHYGNGQLIYGGVMSGWANERYPGAFFSEHVAYTAVAGKAVKGDPTGTKQQRRAYRLYRDMSGNGHDLGDGIVPVTSALLEGAHPIELDGVAHFTGFRRAWYGDRDVVSRWWCPSQTAHTSVP